MVDNHIAFSFSSNFQLDISIHSITAYVQHHTNLNRAFSLLSCYNYDEILIRGDLTYADMPTL